MRETDDVPIEWEPLPKTRPVCILTPPFPVRGTLAIGLLPGGERVFPKQVVERLYLLQNNRRGKVTNLDQLAGWVALPSPEAALAFVRLKTDLDTWHLFWEQKSPPWAEVIPTRGRRIGQLGYCHPLVFDKLGLPPTTVTMVPGGYCIRRNLLLWKAHSEPVTEAVAVEETVGREGHYRFTLGKTYPLSAGNFAFPFYD